MAKSVVAIQSPAGGLYKRKSLQAHPPFTTPDCMNVRLDDTFDGRERVGSRPGMAVLGTPSGTGAVRLLQSVRYFSGESLLTKVIAVRGDTVSHSVDGVTWTPIVQKLGATTGLITAAEYHQKIYIAEGPDQANGKSFNIYDPSDDSLDVDPTPSIVDPSDPTIGVIPPNCRIVVRYRDRLLLCGDTVNQHLWYMSRSGDALDWDTTATDVLSAVTATTSDAGALGEPIRCAAPHGDDCCIFGCEASIWTMRSDPNFGGTLDNLSERVGIIDAHAWTRTPGGWLYFLTQDGLMNMRPGCGDVPISLSRERLPEELLFVDRTTHTVSMDYDIRFRGINMFVTPNTAGTTTHWWIDVKQTATRDQESSASFWPVKVDSTRDAFHTVTYEAISDADKSSSVIGCRDGRVRYFNQQVECEEQSYVDYGPLSSTGRTGNYLDGRIDIINAVLASESAPVRLKIRAGESPEAAFDGRLRQQDTLHRQHTTIRPRIRDPFYMIRIESPQSGSWAMEGLTSVISPAGRKRFR